MTSFNMQNKLHYQVPWLSFTEISLRTFWPLCKSSCDSFVLLQNVGYAETPNSAFGNIPSTTTLFPPPSPPPLSETQINLFPSSAQIRNAASLALFHSQILYPGVSQNNFPLLRFCLLLFTLGL